MFSGVVIGAMHQLVELLLYPVLAALMLAMLLTLWELGMMLAERFYILPAYRRSQPQRFGQYASRRLERSDLLTRSGPILGLMGTLIPLGPGLTALGNGNIDILATALTVAFDTTVMGLLIGLLAYVISRVRRRWYEQLWQQLTEQSEHEAG
ncbi:MotA/TolQ/ExbB proton channel family protein [Parathalassolituus penaei]|uniref:MotA/TolQ/ExbB proton channel family protein n=1 Tax=Parathalassolituus penaei TaxID=2997323 RepID=A0A9X3EAD9_9GAMM|nr:MotA/TolQ/ExbB proton channel family protein [Parathalassolituus penaei]MCY0963887.1 MotA/TolQ/ExbB proton channel family protein [Parathalassolituus penaei]